MSRRAVVTGATGFIGGGLTRRLLEQGWEVIALARQEARVPAGARFVRWELRAAAPEDALAGAQAVFHVAARVGDWGRAADYTRDNVEATARLLAATERARVPAFVYTGSPSAFLGDEDVEGADERIGVPPRFLSEYARSKAEADALVRAHSGSTRTVVLRPHAVIAPGERHLLRLVRLMARVNTVVQIGDGPVRVSLTSLETCVAAHVRAAERLLEGLASGQAFFVADEPWVDLRARLAEEVARLSGRRPRVLVIPRRVALAMAAFAEWFHRPFPFWPPVINRYRVAMLSRSHWFDVSRMKQVLGPL